MKPYDYDCPIEATISIIGGKWKAISLYYLIDGSKRFNELVSLLETVSSRILSKQLKELEIEGIITRSVYAETPPKVEYSLSNYGKTLIPVINLICEWGELHLKRTGKVAVYN
jgi:DNA-binding HxlR family transcriptional regulator